MELSSDSAASDCMIVSQRRNTTVVNAVTGFASNEHATGAWPQLAFLIQDTHDHVVLWVTKLMKARVLK